MQGIEIYCIALLVVSAAWVGGLTYQAVELNNVPVMTQEAKLPQLHGANPPMIGDQEAFLELQTLQLANLFTGHMLCSCDHCQCVNASQTLVQIKKPVINGCGPEWLPAEVVKYLNIFDFKPCCDNHDACYGKCGSSRKACDLHFLQCLQKQCLSQSKEKVCKDIADIFYGTVRVAGCYAAFIPTQHECCECQ